jgi:hypothetical protein
MDCCCVEVEEGVVEDISFATNEILFPGGFNGSSLILVVFSIVLSKE